VPEIICPWAMRREISVASYNQGTSYESPYTARIASTTDGASCASSKRIAMSSTGSGIAAAWHPYAGGTRINRVRRRAGAPRRQAGWNRLTCQHG